ncbi:MAG: hypothetical protein EG828_03330 [Deltaproteobacteria bacterium]|nr:hypothetical protein [Deltaproteobacteria bacterium]
MIKKIYLFNLKTGAYLGEDFADESPWKRGEYLIPDDATLIPPPQVEPGQMPFFTIREQRWEIRNHPGRAASRLRDTLDNEV